MLHTNQPVKAVTALNPQSNYSTDSTHESSENKPSENVSGINLPIVPPTPPSVTGSDLFYLIIALTVFTKVVIEAIAHLTKIIVQANASNKK